MLKQLCILLTILAHRAAASASELEHSTIFQDSTKDKGTGVVFYALCFGTGFTDYGYKAVESAAQYQDRMTKFIIVTTPDFIYNATLLSPHANSKLEILPVLRSHDFYHNSKSKRVKRDFAYAQITVFIKSIQHSEIHYPDSHVVIEDLDILWVSRDFMEVFDRRPFTVGIASRPENKYAAVNIALILAHASRLGEARAFFELTLRLYRQRSLTYYELQTRAFGTSCCAQHVVQHGLEIVLEDNKKWAQNLNKTTYFSRPIQLDPATDEGYQQNASNFCLQSLPNITESFVYLALPVQKFIPSADSSKKGGVSAFTDTYALHYKGGLKKVNMAADYVTMMALLKENASLLSIVKHRQPNVTTGNETCLLECCGEMCRTHEPTKHIGNCTHRPWFTPFDEHIRKLNWPDTKNIDKNH